VPPGAQGFDATGVIGSGSNLLDTFGMCLLDQSARVISSQEVGVRPGHETFCGDFSLVAPCISVCEAV